LKKLDLPDLKHGKWTLEKFTVDRTDWSSLFTGREVPLGETYTKLMRNGTIVMSDTPAELADHSYAVFKAKGSCLVNGLGMGAIIRELLLKQEVTDITVIEIDQELIEMMGPYYQNDKITIIHDDALKYQPQKGKRYQMVWHDIWDNICSDNLPDMHKLHRKYGRRTDWQASWQRDQCERLNKSDRW